MDKKYSYSAVIHNIKDGSVPLSFLVSHAKSDSKEGPWKLNAVPINVINYCM